MDKLLTMSTKELSRLEVMQRLVEKRMIQREAAEVLDVSVRQVKRLLRVYRRDGAEGLMSRRRGKPSNNHLPEETRFTSRTALRSESRSRRLPGISSTPRHRGLSVCHRRLFIDGLVLQPFRRQFVLDDFPAYLLQRDGQLPADIRPGAFGALAGCCVNNHRQGQDVAEIA